jgi:hypothetical protein
MCGGGELISFIVEISRNSEVGRGNREERMAEYQEGKSNQEDTYCQKFH